MTQSHTLKVTLYDDNAELRVSISNLFAVFPEFEFLGAYADANHLIENCRYRKPDVVLMDIDMPGISGIEAVSLLKTHFPEIKVLILTVFDDDQKVFTSICNGAVGYILKKEEPTSILEAVKDAYAGGAPMTNIIATKVLRMFREQAPTRDESMDLTEREKEILTLLTLGLSYKMIASESQLSIDTVRFHIKKIYEKLHVHSMTEAVSKAIRNNLV